MSYKVKFISVAKPGSGYIDGYPTSKRAKYVVERVNEQYVRDGQVYAEYLGKEK